LRQLFHSTKPLCAACFIWAVILAAAAQARNWTDAKGRQIEANFVRVAETDVILQRGNKVMKVPFVNLSDADQAFVQEKLKESGKLSLLPPTDAPRQWTDSAGNQTTAAYVRLDEAGEEPLVVIRRDNDVLSLPYDKFSPEDQSYVRSQLTAQGKRSRLLPPDENAPPAVAGPGPAPGAAPAAPMSNLARQMQERRQRQAEAQRQLDEQRAEQQRLAQQQREQAQAEALRQQQARQEQERQRQLAAAQENAPRSPATEIRDDSAHCSVKLPDGWQLMSQKELDAINSAVAAQGVRYIDGARVRGGIPGTLPYLLVQVSSDDLSQCTHDDLEKAFTERWRAEAIKGGYATQAGPKMDRDHDRIVMRNRIRLPDGRMLANVSIAHFGKTHSMIIHAYDDMGAIEGRMSTLMAMSNALKFDPGFEFAPPQTQVSVFRGNGQGSNQAEPDAFQYLSQHFVEICVGLLVCVLGVAVVIFLIIKLAGGRSA
jgi:hypothetical protein